MFNKILEWFGLALVREVHVLEVMLSAHKQALDSSWKETERWENETARVQRSWDNAEARIRDLERSEATLRARLLNEQIKGMNDMAEDIVAGLRLTTK